MRFLDNLLGQKNKEPKNPELVRAINEVALNDNPKTRKAMYEALLQSWLLLPTPEIEQAPSQPHMRTLTKDEHVEFITLEGPEGNPNLPVFTDSESLIKWKPEGCNYIALPGATLFSFALQNDTHSIIINPAGPTGGELTQREITILAQGLIPEVDVQSDSKVVPMTVAADRKVLIGAPAQRPSEELVARLRAGMERHPQITEGYLAQVHWGETEPHLVVGVGFSAVPDEPVVRRIMEDLSKAIHPLLAEDESVDFIVLRDDDIGRSIRNLNLAVFQRS